VAAQESRLERGSKIQDSTGFWDGVTQCNFARKNARAQGDKKVGHFGPVNKSSAKADQWRKTEL
jgi:hypothetical protein